MQICLNLWFVICSFVEIVPLLAQDFVFVFSPVSSLTCSFSLSRLVRRTSMSSFDVWFADRAVAVGLCCSARLILFSGGTEVQATTRKE